MSALTNWLKKKKKQAKPQEVEFKPLGIDTHILLISKRLKRLDKMAKARKNQRDPAALAKIERAAYVQMSLKHHLQQLAHRIVTNS